MRVAHASIGAHLAPVRRHVAGERSCRDRVLLFLVCALAHGHHGQHAAFLPLLSIPFARWGRS